MSPHSRPKRFAEAESEKLLPNTWPSAAESSWILSLFYFSRPEGHLLGTYGHFRVLVLHPFRLLGATHQPRLFSQMSSPSNHCVMWIWDVHMRKCPLSIKHHHMAALFSILSLCTTSWRQSSSESCLSKVWSHWSLKKPWIVSLHHKFSATYDLILFGGLWHFTVSLTRVSGQLLLAIINELTSIISVLGLT